MPVAREGGSDIESRVQKTCVYFMTKKIECFFRTVVKKKNTLNLFMKRKEVGKFIGIVNNFVVI